MIHSSIAEAKGSIGGLIASFGRAGDASRRDLDGARVLTSVGVEVENPELGCLVNGR